MPRRTDALNFSDALAQALLESFGRWAGNNGARRDFRGGNPCPQLFREHRGRTGSRGRSLDVRMSGVGALRRCKGTGSEEVFCRSLSHFAVTGVEGIGFGRESQVHGGLREGEMAFRDADKIGGLHGGDGDAERGGVGEADIFAGHAHQAARDVKRSFAGFEHAREPVKRGVGIGITHRLVQRGNQVVMLLAGLVVQEEFALQCGGQQIFSDDASAVGFGNGGAHQGFESVVGGAGVAIGENGDALENAVGRQRSFRGPGRGLRRQGRGRSKPMISSLASACRV